MTLGKYILNKQHQVRKENSLRTWGLFMEKKGIHRVALDINKDKVKVSTVFLGLDHNFSGKGPPLLFETMVFGGEYDDYQERYATWNEAVAGHERIKEKIDGEVE